MTSDLQLAIELAEQAGQLTLSYFSRKSLQVFTKRDATPVTEADRKAEELIRIAITSRNPEDGVLGEEFEERPSSNNRRWIIDPIDGTKAFIHGVPLYGVMIALEIDGTVSLGVVHFPALRELYYAERGIGAFLNGSPITVSSISDVRDATVLFTEKEYLLDQLSQHPVDLLRHKAALVRGWGDCYGHMLVASGRAEVSVDKIMSPWDCAALIPIVTEAGGCCFDYKGKTTISGEGLVSANRVIGSALLSDIEKSV
ncbi:MAG: histidinol-phosphatase [Chlorobiaceae bacterium]|jgi:histidinol phosphatase-like enzyme (inositol monophosphatase family)|nr:histidinol-phosphatase [Chlorobiaceae bacterium]NTV16656.1 histidinol-phosphatase [Chlorobiaceae bacterium]